MKTIFFILLSSVVVAQSTNNLQNYALVDSSGNVVEMMVSSPEVAQTYPKASLKEFPNAVLCVPAIDATYGWNYNFVTKVFTAPTPSVVNNPTPAFTIKNPTPVTFTNNNAAVTTNNAAQ